jgi:hypothetical protein
VQWFDVDKQGLARILARKGKEFVLFELVQNGWDEETTHVNVTLARIPGTRQVRLVVEDDNPDGFADLSHAFTLFAESSKKSSATKRGRFNLGEKLVLALCDEAEIVSTRGTIRFDSAGRHATRAKRDRGSIFTGVLRMTNEDIELCQRSIQSLLPPGGIQTVFNGQSIAPRVPLATATATLATEIADDEGLLRRTQRKTQVEIHEALPGEVPSLYEMGIPVVATGDKFHLNVLQKIPLNLDRDNVPPAYLARVRAVAVEHMYEHLTSEDANAPWVRDAVQRHGDEMGHETVERLTALRFGTKRVIFDPTDPEANSLAMAQGFTVVYGSQLSKPEWDAVKRVGAMRPAGQVTPSPKPFSPDGEPLKLLSEEKWTPEMRGVVAMSKRLGQKLLGVSISVAIANDITWPFSGAYGDGRLTMNLGRLGHRWFGGPLADINRFLIHEFGHHFSMNHMSSDYHDALCRLGGQMAALALEEPEVFQRLDVASSKQDDDWTPDAC